MQICSETDINRTPPEYQIWMEHATDVASVSNSLTGTFINLVDISLKYFILIHCNTIPKFPCNFMRLYIYVGILIMYYIVLQVQ